MLLQFATCEELCHKQPCQARRVWHAPLDGIDPPLNALHCTFQRTRPANTCKRLQRDATWSNGNGWCEGEYRSAQVNSN